MIMHYASTMVHSDSPNIISIRFTPKNLFESIRLIRFDRSTDDTRSRRLR